MLGGEAKRSRGKSRAGGGAFNTFPLSVGTRKEASKARDVGVIERLSRVSGRLLRKVCDQKAGGCRNSLAVANSAFFFLFSFSNRWTDGSILDTEQRLVECRANATV